MARKLSKPALKIHTPSEFILYQAEDGRTRIQCRFEDETIWLSQALIAELFQKDVRTINEHLSNIYAEDELSRGPTIRKFRIVRQEGARQVSREVEHYNLSAILAVGYRVRSHRGTQFRQWATERLGEYLLKGFIMDDERLKNPPGPGQTDYFEEQLERIRDIRSSERRFYQKILDIYATSLDYSPNTDLSRQFFATVQNKTHWAITAFPPLPPGEDRGEGVRKTAKIVNLATWREAKVRKDDVAVAKNYLTPDELNTLSHIVTLYLDFAELQAQRCKVMTMSGWIAKLDDFLKLSDHELLDHVGMISAEQAKAKAELEYSRYRTLTDAEPRPVDADFDNIVRQLPPANMRKKGGEK